MIVACAYACALLCHLKQLIIPGIDDDDYEPKLPI